MLWLVPYTNATTADYTTWWLQIGELASHTRGLSVAASAYALKHDGSFGYADTSAGEPDGGQEMEQYGMPALRRFGVTLLGMCYFTHGDGIAIVLSNPQPFIDQVIQKVIAQNLSGMDLDYEPQQVAAAERALAARHAEHPGSAAPVSFPSFLALLAEALAAAGGFVLTIDGEGGAPGSCASIPCSDYAKIKNLLSVNTMDTFNIRDVKGFQGMLATDLPVLGEKWAPGFEPANLISVWGDIVQAAIAGNVTQITSWACYEWNTQPQPQGLIDGIAAFLT